jgi:photosystem II protein|tara:strand:+ start:7477 stop:7830 length:354 start_codon:yes stop_codon:yes gene_type:complete
MTVKIQFILGIDENVIPEIRLTKSNNASTGTAIFQFKNPNIFNEEINEKKSITGMYLIDNESIIITKRLITYFINGKPQVLEAIYIIRNSEEWERLVRFLTRFSESNNLTFIQTEKN